MDILIVSMVSLVAIAGHVWIYRWVKFKIHEGAVLNVLTNDQSSGGLTSAAIAVTAQLHTDRVNAVCERSKQITTIGSGLWQPSTRG